MSATANTYSIKNPYIGSFISSEALCPISSGKDTRHIQIQVPAAELPYTVGDSLCVIPQNHPELVDAVLHAVPCAGDEVITAPNGETCSVAEALSAHCTLSKISGKCLKWYALTQDVVELQELIEDKEQQKEYIGGRDVLDLLTEYPPSKDFVAQEFIDVLGKIIPRLYSIASSQKHDPTKIELTIAAVEWESLGRKRFGVASTYLCHRCQADDEIRCYIHHAKKFKLPTDTDTDIIMVGPGTGIAPFRAFMQDRVADNARGRNWLYFGDWRRSEHFYYGDEWQAYVEAGQLQHLDLAFSRDQEHKIYVQHLLKNNAQETWEWLDSGAHFYVCGDAARMAKDVDDALHKIVAEAGGKGEDGAKAYVEQMIADGRYQRDVY